MSTIKMTIEKEFERAEIDNRLYGSFLEHLGRAIYTGIYEPDHPEADEQGFRKDVIRLVKDLDVSIVRYPGGNFLSGYNWQDGIGPKENRPKRLDLAWRTIEPNLIGIDEFVDWAAKAGTEIMGAVNMGTGTPKEAGEFLEYCNFPKGTYWSDLRIKNGGKDPYKIKTWCIGNEMDGPWQICHLDAVDYGKKARETAKIMKWIDESIELVAVGSSTSLMDTYPEWDRTVLEHTFEHVDYLSLHRYYENLGSERDFLASFVDMDRFIKSVASTVDYVKSLKRSSKNIYLSFDEWNVWYQQKQTRFDWEIAPPILEDQYSLLDALVFGGLGITLINNADRVKMACLAQLVNVIAPIFTEKNGRAIKQATYWPFQDISKYGRGTVLQPVIKSPTIETSYGDAPVLNLAAVNNKEEKVITIFCVNIDESQSHFLNVDMRSFGKTKMISRHELAGGDLHRKNSFDNPNNVEPKSVEVEKEESSEISLQVKPLSWNVIRFSYE